MDEVEKLQHLIALYKSARNLYPHNSLEVTLHGIDEETAQKAGLIDCSFIAKDEKGKRKIINVYQLDKEHWTLKVFTKEFINE